MYNLSNTNNLKLLYLFCYNNRTDANWIASMDYISVAYIRMARTSWTSRDGILSWFQGGDEAQKERELAVEKIREAMKKHDRAFAAWSRDDDDAPRRRRVNDQRDRVEAAQGDRVDSFLNDQRDRVEAAQKKRELAVEEMEEALKKHDGVHEEWLVSNRSFQDRVRKMSNLRVANTQHKRRMRLKKVSFSLPKIQEFGPVTEVTTETDKEFSDRMSLFDSEWIGLYDVE